MRSNRMLWQVVVAFLLLAQMQPNRSFGAGAFFEDFEDGGNWTGRWTNVDGAGLPDLQCPTAPPSPSGDCALRLGVCGASGKYGAYRSDFDAALGYYELLYCVKDSTVGEIVIQASDFSSYHLGAKHYRIGVGYSGRPFELSKRVNNVSSTVASIEHPRYAGSSWFEVFFYRPSNNVIIAGYQTFGAGSVRDSILYIDPDPILSSGRYMLHNWCNSSFCGNLIDGVSYSPVAPYLTLDSTSLSFAAYQNCPLPPSKSFTITNTGGGTLDWLVTDDSTWLDETPTSGSSNSQVITVSVNTTNKTPGTYMDTIRVSSTDADNSPQKVVVTYVVSPGPHLVVAPSTLSFTASQHCALPASQSFSISNSNPSSCTLNWAISCVSPWLDVAPITGTSNNQTITVSVNTTGLSLGLHCDTLCITSTNADNSPQQVIVCYTVTPGPHMIVTPMALSFSAAQNGPLPAPQTFTISNSTGCTLNWEVLEIFSWLEVSPTGPGSSNDETITVSVNTTSLPAALHTTAITVNGYNADNSPVLVSISYSILAQSDTVILGRSTHAIPECGEQYYPIYLNNHQKIKGGYIPLKFPVWDFYLDSISLDGTRLASMQQADYWIDSVSKTALILFQAQTGPVYNILPAVDAATIDQPIAKIYISEACNAPLFSGAGYLGGLDTATIYRQYDTLRVVLTDSLSASVTPAVLPDSVRISALCGDANADGAVDISDAVNLICYIFTPNCLLPCVCGADVNCDGARDISDAVYLISYIFSGGPAPCACKMGLLPKAFPTNATIGINELGVNSTGIAAVTEAAASALQLAFTVPSGIEITSVASNIDGMEVFSGMVDGEFRVGLIDMTGRTTIPAGRHDVVTINYRGEGQIELKDAIVVGEDATKMNVTITNKSITGDGGVTNALPKTFSLAQNVPNPFNPTTAIAYAVPHATQVKLDVMNILGQTVRTLVDEYKAAGNYSVIWDGRDNNHQSVASGIYLYRLTANDYAETRKMVLMK